MHNITENNRCSLPWTDMTNINLDTGSVTPCCKIPVSPIDPVNGIFNKTVIEVRQAIKANIRSLHCKNCWDIIDNGGISRRTQYSIHDNLDWDTVDVMQPITHIQVKFSKTCQLQCVYCGPWSSTTWQNNITKYTEFRNVIPDSSVPGTSLVELIDVSLLKTIQVSGGEPMMDDNCIDFLEKLPFSSDRRLSIITNLSYGRATLNKLLNIIKLHPNIKIYASLDAIGENKSRKYLNWDLWKTNFDILIEDLQIRIVDFPDALVNIKPTINSVTYQHTADIVNFVIEYKKKNYQGITFRFGTPFRDEMSSMWSTEISKDAKIKLNQEDLSLLDSAEIKHIELFNEMLDNAIVDIALKEKTNRYIKIYNNE